MAETSGPFDGTDLAEADWEAMLQHLVDGVPGSPGSSNLGASASGSTARGVDIAAGSALVRGHWYRSSAVITVTSAANAAGTSRIDRAVLRLDRTANTVTVGLLQGTAGSGQPPALTDDATTTERPLYRWTITPGATTASALTDERQWLGSLIRPATSTNRPLSPFVGQAIYETDTGLWVGWTGAAWKSIGAEDTGWVPLTISVASEWTQVGTVAARRVGSTVSMVFEGRRTREFNIGDPNGSGLVTLPADMAPTGSRFGTGVFTSGGTVRIIAGSSGSVIIDRPTVNVPVGADLRCGLTFMI